MRKRTLDRTIQEAERFLERARALNRKFKEEKISLSPDSKLEFEAYNFLSYTAAVRRASLDLTKALADLRMDR